MLQEASSEYLDVKVVKQLVSGCVGGIRRCRRLAVGIWRCRKQAVSI